MNLAIRIQDRKYRMHYEGEKPLAVRTLETGPVLLEKGDSVLIDQDERNFFNNWLSEHLYVLEEV